MPPTLPKGTCVGTDTTSNMLVAPSGGGKTQLLLELIPKGAKVYWCYGVENKEFFNKLRQRYRVKFIQGCPTFEQIPKDHGAHLVFDDLLCDFSDIITKFFIKGRSQKCLHVYFLTQNLFDKKIRTLSLNTQRMFLFANPRDQSQIMTLARQVAPGDTKFFMNSYRDAVSRPYGHMRLDLRGTTPEHMKYTTVDEKGREFYYKKGA